MISKDWTEIKKLDIERRTIQDRISARAAINHGFNQYQNSQGVKMMITRGIEIDLKTHPAEVDAARYVWIQDRQWDLMGVVTRNKKGQVPPI